MKARLASAAVATALWLATPAAVQAQQPDRQVDYDTAKKHYQAGEDAARRADWAEAAKRFGMAYEITKDPVLFYKIATAYEAAGDCKAAVIYYGRYLAEAKPEQRFVEKTEAKVAACEQKGRGQVEPTTQPSGEPAGTAPPRTQPPESGQPATDGETPPGPGGPPPFAGTEPSWMQTAAWASVGAVVTFATIGAVLGLSASSREEDIENLFVTAGDPQAYQGAIKARYLDLIDEGEQLEVFSYVSFGVAGAAALVAVGLFVFDDTPTQDAEGTAVAPTIAPDQIGMSASWRF